MSVTFSVPRIRERVVSIVQAKHHATCMLANRTNILVSNALAAHLAVGDEITFPIPTGARVGTEIYVVKRSPSSGRHCCVYQVPIANVRMPKLNKCSEYYVSAHLEQQVLGISAILIPCRAIRDYFYSPRGAVCQNSQPNFYEALRIPASASPAELRLAYRLRTLEVNTEPGHERLKLERIFNILGQPELRACYDALLADPEGPAIFPYGAVGSLLVSGERSRDGQTFFANRILAFSPEQKQCRFHLPLRQCDFYEDRAFCRDSRRKLDFWIDPALLHVHWDATWNQWKHLLTTKIEVNGTFVDSARCSKHHGGRELVRWETGLPSSLLIQASGDLTQQLEAARMTYLRFGQYSRALDQIRLSLEHRAVEKAELQRMCAELRIPSDFDIAQISWRPDYDPFFYEQLSHRARRIYLFRGEYIFDVEKAVVVETPRLGHATYVFAKPRSMQNFLVLYTRSTKDDIRHNRDNVGERLGFLGRVIHGDNPKAWLKEMRQRLGEKVDFASAAVHGAA